MRHSVRAAVAGLVFIWFLLWRSGGHIFRGADGCTSRFCTPDFLKSSTGNESLWGLEGQQNVRLPAELRDIFNGTLGFQKIYVISMPARRDKRDALAISSYLTGLELEFVDGVSPDDVAPAALPPHWNNMEVKGSIGCWRGHMEVYQKMVREKIQTALIMEDDSDWDVLIKSQMAEFARGTRHLQGYPRISSEALRPPTRSPYGDKWDFLFSGHCGFNGNQSKEGQYWMTRDDPTSPTKKVRELQNKKFWQWQRTTEAVIQDTAGDHGRLVAHVAFVTCLASYAVTIQSAAKILYDQGILPHGTAIDDALGFICKRGEAACFAPWPTITGTHLAAGNMSKDSDRRVEFDKDKKNRDKAVSLDLVYPVRGNIPNLIDGGTVVKPQYPKVALLKEIDLSTYRYPLGKPWSAADADAGTTFSYEEELEQTLPGNN